MAAPGKKKGKKEKKQKELTDPKDIEIRIDHLKYLDQPIKDLRKLFRTYKNYYNKDEKKALATLKEIEEGLKKGMDGWKNLRHSLVFDLLRLSIDEIEEFDVDTTEFRKHLEGISIEGDLEKKDLKSLEDLRSEMEPLFEKHPETLSPEAFVALEKALDSYEDAVKTGKELSKTKKYFKKILNLMKKGDLKNILVFSNLLHTTVQSELGEDLAKDRFKSIKKEISSLMDTMEEYRKYGIEQETIVNELKRLEKGLDPSKFNEAKSTLNRITKNMARTEKEFFRRKANVSLLNVQDLIDEYGSLIDLKKQESRMENLKEELTTISPRKFLDESQSVLDEVKGILYDNFEGQVRQRLEVMDHDLDRAEHQSKGDKERIIDLREHVTKALDDRNITEAMEYLSLAESLFGQADGEMALERARTRYMDLLGSVENLLAENMEMDEVKNELETIENLFLGDDLRLEPIVQEVEKAEGMIKEKVVELRRDEFAKNKDEMLSMIDQIDLGDERREGLIREIQELEETLSELEEPEFREKMTSIRQSLDNEMSNYFKDSYEQWVTNIQHSMEKLDLDDEIRSTIEQRIDDAGRSYRERDYLDSGNILRDVSQHLKEVETNREIEEAESLINSAEFLFEEANRSGVDVSEQSKMLVEAKSLLESGDISASKEMASLVESSVKERWMESKKEHLREDLNGLKEFFVESTGLGLDIEDASSFLDEAESLFEKGKYDEVNEKVFEARDLIDNKRNEYFSSGTMDTISDLKREIDQLNDLGINTVEAETLLIEAERLFMEEEYEKSYSMALDIKEHLNFSKGAYLTEDVPRRMEELASRVGKLEGMGLDTELARSYLDEASQTQSHGDLVKTLNNLEKADEIAGEIYRSHITLTIPETLVEVKGQLDNALSEGLELDDIGQLLMEAEELFNNENYDQALETIEKVQTDIETRKEDFYKNKYVENMDLVERMMGDARGMDNEIDLSKDNVNMAKDAFERGDFQASYKLMEKVMKFMEHSMEEKEFSKRREVVQTYFDEVRTLLSVAEAENIDIEEEKRLFSIAGDLLADGDFDQAEHVLEGIKIGLQEKRVQMKKRLIESSIQTTEILLENMRDMGIDTSYETNLINQLKEALRLGDLDLCDEINRKLQNALHRNQGPYLVQKIQRELSELRGRMVEANSNGIDTTGVQKHLSTATDMFERGDIEGAQEEIHRGNVALEEAYRIHDEKEYQKVLEELQRQLIQLQKMGIPTEDEEGIMETAQAAYGEGRMEEATSYLETALIGAKAKMNSFQATTAEGYIQQIENYLEELKGSGIDISDLIKIYEEGLELHSRGEDDKAVAKFSSILELGEEVRTLREIDQLRDRLDKQENLYDDLREVGMGKVTKLENAVSSAKKLIDGDSLDIEKLSAIIEKIEILMGKKSRPYMEALVKKHIGDARKELKEFEKKEGESAELRKSIREAATLMRNGDLKGADELALGIINTVEKSKLDETESILKEEVASVRQMLTRLKTLGSNVSTAEKLLSRAETTLLEGKVDNAEKLINNVRESVKEIVRRNMRETSLETIEFVDAMIHYILDNFSGVSQKLGPAEEHLDKARNLFRDKKFKAAKTEAEEARSEVEKLDIQNIKQFFYVFRSSQATEMSRNVQIGISELKEKGIDTSKVAMLYQKAQEHFEEDEFDRGRQMITLARIMLAEIDQQSLRDNAFDELNNAHVEILTRKREGANVTPAYRIYNNAKEAFSTREYKKAILLAKKAGYQARKA